MEPTSGEKRQVLYHAVSSYQLLEAVLHRLRFHPGDPAVLLAAGLHCGEVPQIPAAGRAGLLPGGAAVPLPAGAPPQRGGGLCRGRPGLPEGAALPLGGLLPGLLWRGPTSTLRCASSRRASPSPFSRTRLGCSPGRGSWEATWRGAIPSTRPSRRNTACSTAAAPWPGRIVCLKSAQRGPLPPHCADFSVELALEELSPRLRNKLVRLFLPHPPVFPGGGHPPHPASSQFGGCHLGGPAPAVPAPGPGAPQGGAAARQAPPRRRHGLPGNLPQSPGAAAGVPGGAAALRLSVGPPGGVHPGFHQLRKPEAPFHHHPTGEGPPWTITHCSL